MDLGLKGRRALVTGASMGLGAAAAMALAQEGVEVAINSRSPERLEKTAARIKQACGLDPIICPGDLTKPDEIERILKQAGPVDILVSNTGGPPSGRFIDHPPERWNEAGDLLLNSAINLTRGVLDNMRKQAWGRLIYITSVAVLEPIDDLILSNTYRAAITGFCKTVSNNHAAEGITANCVCPGYTLTERLHHLAEDRAASAGKPPEVVLEGFADAIPAGRLGRPEEPAALIAFLASDKAAYITGCSIPVDGGLVKALI